MEPQDKMIFVFGKNLRFPFSKMNIHDKIRFASTGNNSLNFSDRIIKIKSKTDILLFCEEFENISSEIKMIIEKIIMNHC